MSKIVNKKVYIAELLFYENMHLLSTVEIRFGNTCKFCIHACYVFGPIKMIYLSSFRKFFNLSAVYSPPLSDLMFLGVFPNLVCTGTCPTYSLIFSGTSDLCAIKY